MLCRYKEHVQLLSFLILYKNYFTQAQAANSQVYNILLTLTISLLYNIPFYYLTLAFFGMCLVLAYW